MGKKTTLFQSQPEVKYIPLLEIKGDFYTLFQRRSGKKNTLLRGTYLCSLYREKPSPSASPSSPGQREALSIGLNGAFFLFSRRVNNQESILFFLVNEPFKSVSMLWWKFKGYFMYE